MPTRVNYAKGLGLLQPQGLSHYFFFIAVFVTPTVCCMPNYQTNITDNILHIMGKVYPLYRDFPVLQRYLLQHNNMPTNLG